MQRLLFFQDGGKKTLNKKNAAILGIILASGAYGIHLASGTKAPAAKVQNSRKKLISNELTHPVQDIAEADNAEEVGGVKPESSEQTKVKHRRKRARRPRKKPMVLKYNAKQVISFGKDQVNDGDGITIGTNFIAKLVTGIDTRNGSQLVKVILPYGGKSKSGESLPSGTMFFGSFSYPGDGERVFLNFTKGMLPSGQQFKVKAEGLDPKDYSPGVVGDHHGTAGVRAATGMGLTMLSAMTGTLVSKEVLGHSETATPESTLENAVLTGVSKVSEQEAQRQAGKIQKNNVDYATVAAGTDLIVGISESFSLTF